MDTATKLKALFWPGSGKKRPGTTPEIPPIEPPAAPAVRERQQDRWFVEQRGDKRVAKRLDVPNEVFVTPAGPLEMKGNITLVVMGYVAIKPVYDKKAILKELMMKYRREEKS